MIWKQHIGKNYLQRFQKFSTQLKKFSTQLKSTRICSFLNNTVRLLNTNCSPGFCQVQNMQSMVGPEMVHHYASVFQVLPGYENIYFAHSSWFTYAATLRIYKHWNFNIVDPYTRTGRVSFSSYPGKVSSPLQKKRYSRWHGLSLACRYLACKKVYTSTSVWFNVP